MAETNNPQVVQAQVVQAQVVGQPVAAGAPYGGTSPYGAPQYVTPDQQSAQNGWMMYGIGWFLCCCFGPIGPIFWFVVACMHFCKPEEARKQLPQERQVACVSLWTAIISLILEIVLIIILVAFVFSTASAIQSTTVDYGSYSTYYRYR